MACASSASISGNCGLVSIALPWDGLDRPRGLLAAVRVDRLEHRGDEAALLVAELRSPDLEQQDHAVAIAAIPRLVLDRVVEHPRLPLDRRPRLVAHAE